VKGKLLSLHCLAELLSLFVSKLTGPLFLPINSFFILSIRAMARSILDPVTMHICEPDNALSFKQSQAMKLSINSQIPSPVAFFIQIYFLNELVLPVCVSKEQEVIKGSKSILSQSHTIRFSFYLHRCLHYDLICNFWSIYY
jgi:hypothetical protein